MTEQTGLCRDCPSPAACNNSSRCQDSGFRIVDKPVSILDLNIACACVGPQAGEPLCGCLMAIIREARSEAETAPGNHLSRYVKVLANWMERNGSSEADLRQQVVELTDKIDARYAAFSRPAVKPRIP